MTKQLTEQNVFTFRSSDEANDWLSDHPEATVEQISFAMCGNESISSGLALLVRLPKKVR